MATDWTREFTAGYRLVRVSRATGYELGALDVAVTGGTIERNQDKSMFESASVGYVGLIDVGPDLLRVYLDATFSDGESVSEPLGTFLASTPDSTSTPATFAGGAAGSMATGTAKLSGRLKELSDTAFVTPVSVAAGEPVLEWCVELVEGCGLECVADSSSYALSETQTFGSFDSSTGSGDTKLDALNALLDLAGFSAARTDPLGRVVLSKYVAPSDRSSVETFREGDERARFLPAVPGEHDSSSVANVIICDYSGQGSDGSSLSIRGIAIDSDPASEWSTVSLGREISARYSYSDLPEGDTLAEMQASANTKAADLLAQRSVIDRRTVTHVYEPLSVSDAVTLDCPSLDIYGKYAIRAQSLALGAGCLIEEETRRA